MNQDGVFQVPKVYLAPKELLASRERRVALDHLVFPDRKVTQDHQAFRESKVRWDLQDLLDWLAYQVLQEKVHPELLDPKDHLESQDHSVGKV